MSKDAQLNLRVKEAAKNDLKKLFKKSKMRSLNAYCEKVLDKHIKEEKEKEDGK